MSINDDKCIERSTDKYGSKTSQLLLPKFMSKRPPSISTSVTAPSRPPTPLAVSVPDSPEVVCLGEKKAVPSGATKFTFDEAKAIQRLSASDEEVLSAIEAPAAKRAKVAAASKPGVFNKRGLVRFVKPEPLPDTQVLTPEEEEEPDSRDFELNSADKRFVVDEAEEGDEDEEVDEPDTKHTDSNERKRAPAFNPVDPLAGDIGELPQGEWCVYVFADGRVRCERLVPRDIPARTEISAMSEHGPGLYVINKARLFHTTMYFSTA